MSSIIPCFFCGRPWHPSTGTVYHTLTLACRHCVKELYDWLHRRSNAKPARRQRTITTRRSFYEAAGDHLERDERVRSCSSTEEASSTSEDERSDYDALANALTG